LRKEENEEGGRSVKTSKNEKERRQNVRITSAGSDWMTFQKMFAIDKMMVVYADAQVNRTARSGEERQRQIVKLLKGNQWRTGK